MKLLLVALFTADLIVCELAFGESTDRCPPRKIHQEIYPNESPKDVTAAMRTSVALSPEWEDSRILAAFGFTTAMSDRESVRGVDGRQVSYYVGKTKVTIVRSASTGLSVLVSKGRYAGVWHAERCD